jgi:hypothetical protein
MPTEMDLKGTGCDCIDWIRVAQVCNQWEIEMALRIPHVVCDFLNILTNIT